jgi:hypothetical protein
MLQMLGQGVDRDQRLKCLGQLPIALKLVGVQARPLADQSQRPRWQVAVQDLQRAKLDLRDVLAVLSVEVRWQMIGAVHVDHDPVERGQSRHRSIVGDRAAASGADGERRQPRRTR